LKKSTVQQGLEGRGLKTMVFDPDRIPDRSWPEKFQDAFRGTKLGVRGQKSFYVHFFFTAAVVVAGFVFHVDRMEWCLLVLCIVGVLTTEMLNSALEWVVRSLPERDDPRLGQALDIGSAAVLIVSIGSVFVGLLVFVPHLLKMFSGG
jgi:diacylglycerol kinase